MKREFRGWMPLALMVGLMVVIGGYTQSKESSFLSEFNLNGLFIAAIPLALAGSCSGCSPSSACASSSGWRTCC